MGAPYEDRPTSETSERAAVDQPSPEGPAAGSGLTKTKFIRPSVGAVYTTDAVPIAEQGWTKLHVVSIAPIIATALAELLTAPRPQPMIPRREEHFT